MPLALWGSTRNRATLLQHVRTFVTATRYASLAVDRAMEGIHIADCKWTAAGSAAASTVTSPSDHEARQRLARAFVRWLFENLVVNLVKSHFYATETSVHRNCVFYYRKVGGP